MTLNVTLEAFDREFPPLMDATQVARVFGLSRRAVDRLCQMGDEAPDWFVRPEPGSPRRWLKWKLRRRLFEGSTMEVAA